MGGLSRHRLRDRGAPWCCALLLSFGLGCGAPRVLVVGLDGANWQVLDPLIAAGYLPNLGALVRSGATYDLDCVAASVGNPCFCPPVWTSIATGQPASRHRISGFDTPSSARRVKALWNVLHEYGGESRLFAFRGTWPPEQSGGIVLTEPGAMAAGLELFDFIGSPAHPGLAEPHTLAQPVDLLEQLGVLPSPEPPGARLPAWEPFAIDRVSMETLLRVVVRERGAPAEALRPQLTMILLHSPDKSAHLSWNLIQSAQWAPLDLFALLVQAKAWNGPVYKGLPVPWSNVPDPYREIDAWLGKLLAATHYDYVVFVSDHGMTRSQTGLPGQHSASFPEAHVGILAMSGPGILTGPRRTANVLDVAPTVAYLLGLPVADDLPGQVRLEAFSDAHVSMFPLETVPTWE